MIINRIATIDDMLTSLREHTTLTPAEEGELREQYVRVINLLAAYTPQDDDTVNVTVILSPFCYFGEGSRQMIANGNVSDMTRRNANEYNWHLQNTSQWLFGMGFVFDISSREFSIHT